MKGEEISIKIPKEEYRAGLEGCKNHLHGRLVLSKGDAPIKANDLRLKLSSLWKPLGQWNLIPLGKGYYEFSFSSVEDLCSVHSIGSWNTQRNSNVQCWIRFLGLAQEYWRSILHSAKLSIAINGKASGFFSCKRGVDKVIHCHPSCSVLLKKS